MWYKLSYDNLVDQYLIAMDACVSCVLHLKINIYCITGRGYKMCAALFTLQVEQWSGVL